MRLGDHPGQRRQQAQPARQNRPLQPRPWMNAPLQNFRGNPRDQAPAILTRCDNGRIIGRRRQCAVRSRLTEDARKDRGEGKQPLRRLELAGIGGGDALPCLGKHPAKGLFLAVGVHESPFLIWIDARQPVPFMVEQQKFTEQSLANRLQHVDQFLRQIV